MVHAKVGVVGSTQDLLVSGNKKSNSTFEDYWLEHYKWHSKQWYIFQSSDVADSLLASILRGI